nr:uncharacterized protein LOC112543962 [Pelodiscus sinensis]|eukprot:XP_025035058.1 uncharacterized protein LOC112543962 [Pelodiscus sinensis]
MEDEGFRLRPRTGKQNRGDCVVQEKLPSAGTRMHQHLERSSYGNSPRAKGYGRYPITSLHLQLNTRVAALVSSTVCCVLSASRNSFFAPFSSLVLQKVPPPACSTWASTLVFQPSLPNSTLLHTQHSAVRPGCKSPFAEQSPSVPQPVSIADMPHEFVSAKHLAASPNSSFHMNVPLCHGTSKQKGRSNMFQSGSFQTHPPSSLHSHNSGC